MKQRLAHDFLKEAFKKLPDKIALVCEGLHYTYSQLNTLTEQCAHAFAAAGLKRGDRAVIALENSLEQIVADFGTLKAGGVFVNVNFSPDAPALARFSQYLVQTAPALVVAPIASASQIIAACAVLPQPPTLFFVGGSHPQGLDFTQTVTTANLEPFPNQNIDADLACIIYTSGTTGEPKGVAIAHRHVIAAANTIAASLGNTEDDVILCALPLTFTYGTYQMFVTFMTGARLVLEKRMNFAAQVLKPLAAEKVTGFAGVPTTFNQLVQFEDFNTSEYPTLRYVTCAGGAMQTGPYRQLRRAFPDLKVHLMYGQTECARIACLPPEFADERPDSVGFPPPHTEVFIIDEEGQRLGSNQNGELVVRATHVTYGYWQNEIETSKKFRPGEFPGDVWLYTGDIFRRDEEGFLYFVSRKDDIIKSRGEKVAPKAIENVVSLMPGIQEVAAVGVPDEMWGEAIRLFVVLQAGATISVREIKAYCIANLEAVMRPKYIEILDDLPRTVSGKISKLTLKTSQ